MKGVISRPKAIITGVYIVIFSLYTLLKQNEGLLVVCTGNQLAITPPFFNFKFPSTYA